MFKYNFWKWLSVFISFFAYIFCHFHKFSTAALSGQIADEFKVTKDKLGFFTSMYFWPYGLEQPFIGALADLVEPGVLIGVSSLLSGIGSLICGFATSLSQCSFGRLLVGIGCGGVFVPTTKIGANWFSAHAYRYFAGSMIGLGGAGSLLAQTPLAYFGSIFGWRWCLKGVAIMGIVLGILSIIFVRGHPAKRGFVSDIPLIPIPPMKNLFKQLFTNIKSCLYIPDFWLLNGFMYFSPGVFMNLSSLWGVPYLQDLFKIDEKAASNIQMALSFSIIIGSPLLPVIAEKVNSRKKTLIVFNMIAVACCIILALFSQYLGRYTVALLFFFFGVGSNAGQGIALAMYKEFADHSLAATIVGCGNTGPFIGGALAQVYSSALIGSYPHTHSFPPEAYRVGLWFFSAACCTFGCFSLLFIQDRKNKE